MQTALAISQPCRCRPSRTRLKRSVRECADSGAQCTAQHLLFVGAERPEEFALALRLACQGNQVTVVNPRKTRAAKEFQAHGGTFIQARIEQLPEACGQFDVIFENYPYPSGRNYVPPRSFAVERLLRLAPGGCWILFTEAVRFATLLKAAVDYDQTIHARFSVTLSSVSPQQAPPSTYPPVSTRFRLVFSRRR